MEPDNTTAYTTVGEQPSQVKYCDGTYDGRRCLLEAGHLGDHKAIDVHWAATYAALYPAPRPPTHKVALSIVERASLLTAALEGINIPTDTPGRIARWLDQYQVDEGTGNAAEALGAPFRDGHDELVLVKDIQFIALCAHHLLPFKGSAAIAYIPDGLLVGLSKTARLVDYYTRQPTLQEHITANAADTLMAVLQPKGVAVVLYNTMHSCMTMRGIKDPEANTTTSAVRGVFKDSAAARAELFALLRT